MRTLLLSLSLVMWLGAARAEDAYAEVLEYWADVSPHIGIYQFESATPHLQKEDHVQMLLHIYPGTPRSDYELLDVRAKLVRSLRGAPPSIHSVVCSAYTKYPESMPLEFGAEDQFLVFWGEATANEAPYAHVICLTRPSANGTSRKPLVGGALSPAFRSDYTILKDGKMIEQAARERIAARPQARRPPAGFHDDSVARIEIPMMTEAYDALFNLCACYLIIPKDLVRPGQKVVPDRVPVRTGPVVPEEEEEVASPLTSTPTAN